MRPFRHMLDAARRPSPAWVERRVKALVDHAGRHVPYYRDLMAAKGLARGDIRSLADFVDHFPRTDSADYRRAQHVRGAAYLIDERLDADALRLNISSGTSGMPLRHFQSAAERAVHLGRWRRHYLAAGLRPWHRALAVLNLGPNETSIGRLAAVLDRAGLFHRRVVHYLTPVDEIVDVLMAGGHDALYGQKAMLARIAERVLERRPEGYPLRFLAPGAEKVTEPDRALFQAAFRPARYVEFYGAVELQLMAIRRRGDYQIDHRAAFLTLADPAPNGDLTVGRNLATSLIHQAQPILNLDLGDEIAMRHFDRVLALGATIAEVRGRSNDQLVLPDGGRVTGAEFYAALKVFPFMRQFRIRQSRLDACEILVRLASETPENVAAVEAAVHAVLRGRIDHDLTCVDDIPIGPGGKYKILESTLGRPDGKAP